MSKNTEVPEKRIRQTKRGHRTGGHKTADGRNITLDKHRQRRERPAPKQRSDTSRTISERKSTQTEVMPTARSAGKTMNKGSRAAREEAARREAARKRRLNQKKKSGRKRGRQKKRDRQTLWIVLLSILIIAVAAGVFLWSRYHKGWFEKKEQNQITQETTQFGGTLTKDYEQKVTPLVKKYFAAKQKGDADALKTLVNEVSDDDISLMKAEQKIIEEYQNISVSTKLGQADGELVAFVYYEVKFKNIKTAAPGSIILYIKDNGKTIYNYAKDSGLSSYVEQLSKQADVVTFTEEVNQKFMDACNNDEDLKKFCQNLATDE